MISAGRDKVVIIWNLKTGEKMKTIPVSGSVEGLHGLKGSEMHVLLGIESSLVKWDLSAPKQLEALNLGSEITRLQSQDGEESLHCATIDQNLVDVSCPDLSIKNTVVGNNDEIYCITFIGANNSHLLVGCNSSFLRLYKVSDYSCQLIGGHSDTVLCMATSAMDRDTVVTSGKDRCVKIWRFEDGKMQCLVTGSGHSDPVQGVTFLNQSIKRVISVGKDTTIKSWNVDYDTEQMSSIRTEIGHEKEINCCCVSPGDELIATGGQDKVCKIWDKELNLVSTLRGHKRGIWSAQFSPQDQVLATGSADAIIKLWSLTEFTCVKQLEGQECSVLSLTWINGHQIVSTGSDGLVKVWWTTRQECVSTLDSHSDKVWTIAAREEEGEIELTTGSAAGEIVFWKDVTESAKAKKQDEADKLVLGQQKLANLIASRQFSQALKMALRLSQPFTALKLLKKLKYDEISEAVQDLDMAEIDQLLGYTVKWNSNSKHSEAAQSVLNIILTHHKPDDLLKLTGCKTWIEGLLPYTEKHFQRLSRLQMKSKFLVFLEANMKSIGLNKDLPQEEVEQMEE
eukprot:TRINITY_DN76_c0_g2_i1.p1 TRINITY_DN76_c0_g2~~TRINITY_DN76_c0_g2_i1.p1  ORF type:complete len:663 (-),score=82.73 TRINITY_DN76_c0_g2_i1:81-1784(-)